MLEKVLEGFKSVFSEMDTKKKIMAGVGVLFVFIIIIASSCKKNDEKPEKLDDYKNIKTIMTEAAKKYFKDEEILPEVNYEEDVDLDELVKEEYMKDISNYLSEGKSCDGTVLVRNVENKYYYTSILDCDEDYYDYTLAELIELDNEIVTSGVGLYNDGKVKYFRGEVKNNFVKISDYLWRIISVNENGDVQLILNEMDYENDAFNNLFVWDNRYNSETNEYNGKNDFNVSRIKDSLTTLAKNDSIIDPDDRGMLLKRNLCIGSRPINNLTTDNSIECAKKSDELYFFGAITTSDFLRASLDPECKTVTSPVCGNYNYLVSNRQSGWTLTPLAENSYKAYSYELRGLSSNDADREYKIYPTIELHGLTVIDDGIGTADDPYIIQ